MDKRNRGIKEIWWGEQPHMQGRVIGGVIDGQTITAIRRGTSLQCAEEFDVYTVVNEREVLIETVILPQVAIRYITS